MVHRQNHAFHRRNHGVCRRDNVSSSNSYFSGNVSQSNALGIEAQFAPPLDPTGRNSAKTAEYDRKTLQSSLVNVVQVDCLLLLSDLTS